jgi:hypothetical protein
MAAPSDRKPAVCGRADFFAFSRFSPPSLSGAPYCEDAATLLRCSGSARRRSFPERFPLFDQVHRAQQHAVRDLEGSIQQALDEPKGNAELLRSLRFAAELGYESVYYCLPDGSDHDRSVAERRLSLCPLPDIAQRR